MRARVGWLRSALCLFLAVLMAMGTCVTAFAQEENTEPKETINYVSLGASNTNGYGLTGYLPEGVTAADKATANV